MEEFSPVTSKGDEEKSNPRILFIPAIIFILLVFGVWYYISVVADGDGNTVSSDTDVGDATVWKFIITDAPENVTDGHNDTLVRIQLVEGEPLELGSIRVIYNKSGENHTHNCWFGSSEAEGCTLYREDGNSTIDGQFIDGIWNIGDVILLVEEATPPGSVYGPDDDGMAISITYRNNDDIIYSFEYLKVD